MESPGGPSTSTASAVRRSAGALRGSRIQSGRLTPQMQDGELHQSKENVDASLNTKEIRNEGRKDDGMIFEDSTVSKEYDVWDPKDFVRTSNTAISPPGAMNELPSMSFADQIEGKNSNESAPWMKATPKRSPADYDWANFVYAYSRGRWDPSMLPHPPSESNLYPGTSTRISVITDNVKKTSTNDQDAQDVLERIRCLAHRQHNPSLRNLNLVIVIPTKPKPKAKPAALLFLITSRQLLPPTSPFLPHLLQLSKSFLKDLRMPFPQPLHKKLIRLIAHLVFETTHLIPLIPQKAKHL